MITLTECNRQNTCYDCDNEQCIYHGVKGADCPKNHCDRPAPVNLDCEHCAFIDEYIEEMRKVYATGLIALPTDKQISIKLR